MVLDGAKALAIPTSYGQTLKVSRTNKNIIEWKSLDENGTVWYQETFSTKDLDYKGNNPISETLQNILRKAKDLNPEFLSTKHGYNVETALDFPRSWGLGTSSTLIHSIAQWAKIDSYTLLSESFGGSGYDVAVAQYKTPLIYTLEQGQPKAMPIALSWDFTDKIFFVHLNQKQDSKEGIARYQNASAKKSIDLTLFSKMTLELSECKTLSKFITLIERHETAIASIIDLPTIKDFLFSDYPGAIKSLGAWGGDFIMVTGEADDLDYFKKRGYKTIIPFNNMIA